MRHSITTCVAVVLASTPLAASAQGDEGRSFQELVDEGKELYAAEDFAGALDRFERAYALEPTPKLLFNMGLVAERLGELEKAVEYYEEFVGSAGDIPLKLRARGQERLEVLRPIVEDRKRRDAEAVAGGSGETGDGKGKDDGKGKGVEDPGGSEDAASGGSSMPGLVTLGVGVAAAGAGAFMLATLPEEMAFVNEPTADERRSARSGRQFQQIAGYSLVGAGSALVLTGAVLWLTAGPEESQGATLTPVIAPDRVGASFTLSF